MDAVLIVAFWLVSTITVVLACRHRWTHRCAECAWRHRETHPTGRHRADRLALPADPDATSPMLSAAPHRHPRAFQTGRH